MIKQNAPEQSMGQRRNQQGNLKVSWLKWKHKYNTPKFRGCSKTIRRRKSIRINVSIKEKKKRIDILILFLKELEKEEQIKPRVGRRKKI